MEPQIVTKPAFTIVGLNYHGQNKNQEIPQLWGTFMERAAVVQGVINPTTCYGACDNFDEAAGTFAYLAAYEVGADTAVPAGMERWDIPANTYAVFGCTLPTIHEAYGHIYNTWLPQSTYQRAPGPEFELYDEAFNANDPSSLLYLYVPVRQA